MFCSNNMKQGHEGIVIKIALTRIFESHEKIWPSPIVIDKHKTSLNAIQNDVYSSLFTLPSSSNCSIY
jgi:hypothetical protein